MKIYSNDLHDLHPYVEQQARKAIAECERKGLHVGIANTLRNQEKQDELYAQGRTTPGQIITNCKLIGAHGGSSSYKPPKSLALDILSLIHI